MVGWGGPEVRYIFDYLIEIAYSDLRYISDVPIQRRWKRVAAGARAPPNTSSGVGQCSRWHAAKEAPSW